MPHLKTTPTRAPSPITFSIAGSGIYLPRHILPSDEIDNRLGWPAGQCAQRYGLTQRHIAAPDETTSFMAAAAARAALQNADMPPSALDLIIGACGVMEQPIPSTAALVQNRLGLGQSGGAAYDVNATCLSFVQAFELAVMRISLGLARNVLVFSADIASAALDWSNPDAAAIFGDGAAAVVLTAGPSQLLAHRFATYGAGHEICRLEGGGTRLGVHGAAAQNLFQMDGAQAFRYAARHMPAFLAALLDDAGCRLDDLACVIPHQASGPALAREIARLGIDPARVVNTYTRCGNQIAASIPTALHHARANGQLKAGDRALIIGTSAGISLGGMVVQI
ncbi:3-oxoacyl-[acyl-carrier-protein] synthase III [Ketogulonicigenium robustum]|uniref:3-oxoacyl-[acyl-carrier-protein] synthase III n=2 Tax=Ketogulonicigenium robustum TaxID=92947 RepID=A0A1W6NW33_9RHOB|nr:3-oxoacyl-[acyl-carrier-protein] synthase III [Ketogulonicigenium robustum]